MVSIDKARGFVHANGTMWERALWDHLFDNGSINRVHQTLLCYKNPDGGWGHGMEHDIKCPISHPLALEFLLSIFRDTGINPGSILENASQWVEENSTPDGHIKNPPEVLTCPHAPWHNGDEPRYPISIVGNLKKHGEASEKLLDTTKELAKKHSTLDAISKTDWLFMAYYSFDYFMNIEDFDDVEKYREATALNINACALAHEKEGEFNKLFPLFQFVDGPNSRIIKHLDAGLVDRVLDYLENSQREDGGWEDEHGLKHWQPYLSTVILLALKRFGRV